VSQESDVAIAHNRLVEQMRRNMGTTIHEAIQAVDVVEIMLNPDGRLWIERFGVGMVDAGTMDAVQAHNFLSTVAAWLGKVANTEQAILEGALPPEYGSARFEGLLPPLVLAPSFAIRLRAKSVFTLDQYVEKGILTEVQKTQIVEGIRDRKNIVVSGGTGSGKTTLLNAVLQEISDQAGSEQRVVIIEDTLELMCNAINNVSMLADSKVSQHDLLKATLRLRPDRILVGELRDGKAALALLDAWNTGHPGGACTVHANDEKAAIQRIDSLCQRAGVPSQRDLILEAVGYVIQIQRDPSHPSGRRITGILDAATLRGA
jgi:type IV secretion system protein VirB11